VITEIGARGGHGVEHDRLTHDRRQSLG
jgi:hypothetical protein